MIEVEVRAKIENFEKIKKVLMEMGAKLVEEKIQIDKIYGREKDLDENHKIIEGHFSARIRKVNDKIRLDFKEIIRVSGGSELNIDLQNIREGEKFLQAMDFDEAFTLEKKREVFVIDDFKICLDDVKKLGKFIEIERETKDESEKNEIYQKCLMLLRKLAPEAKEEKRKYGDLVQEIINEKGEF